MDCARHVAFSVENTVIQMLSKACLMLRTTLTCERPQIVSILISMVVGTEDGRPASCRTGHRRLLGKVTFA